MTATYLATGSAFLAFWVETRTQRRGVTRFTAVTRFAIRDLAVGRIRDFDPLINSACQFIHCGLKRQSTDLVAVGAAIGVISSLGYRDDRARVAIPVTAIAFTIAGVVPRSLDKEDASVSTRWR
jgi:hypothetical protein